MEGQILGNRYELINKIGGGGMAYVYKARCRLLNRFVAIKILKTELVNDEEFVRRFRIEAQSAASLSHPNVVSIYDVGQEGNIHYIVMEYIDGITLKEYIEQKGRLMWREAVNIAIQICSAIEHAHKHHIVHRDIKPHNILLTKEGIAKVTDFGIARAVTTSTVTMVGNTIGSVHYFSPEQARGGYIDEKSDLYSLGITLYEMITGSVPFMGESAVAVALKHIQDEPVPPIQLAKDIPVSVNQVIMKSLRKSIDTRYQTASAFLNDLYACTKNPDVNLIEDNISDIGATRRIEAITPPNDYSAAASSTYKQDKIDTYDNKNEDEALKKKKRRDKIAVWSAVSIALILIIGILAAVFLTKGNSNVFVVGNYVGQNINDVKKTLDEAKVKYNIRYSFSSDKAKDIIISQNPEAGKEIKPDSYSAIDLEVSKGQQTEKIPDYVNRDYRDAELGLANLGFKTEKVEEYNDTISQGLVIRTNPEANTDTPVGSTVTIYVSKGKEIKKTTVPNLLGKTVTEAQQLLADANLTIAKIVPDTTDNTAKITKQEPAANSQVDENTGVTIYLETTPTPAPTPTPTPTVTYTFKQVKINLEDPENYKQTIKVVINATPSNTGKEQVIAQLPAVKKNQFPLTVNIPVPTGGSTKYTVYLDDQLYLQQTIFDQ